MAVDAGRQYILIVEDDEDLAEGICLSLQSPELTFVRAGTIEEEVGGQAVLGNN